MTLEWIDDTLVARVAGETIPLGSVEPETRPTGWHPWAHCRARIWRWTNTAPSIAGGHPIRGRRSSLSDARAALEKSVRTCCLAHHIEDALDRPGVPDAAVARLARVVRGLRADRDARMLERIARC